MARLHASISEEALDIWRSFARSRGVSVTALLEVLASELDRLDQPEQKLPVRWRQLIAEARSVDAERRSRSQPD